jgi:hypothetical protein
LPYRSALEPPSFARKSLRQFGFSALPRWAERVWSGADWSSDRNWHPTFSGARRRRPALRAARQHAVLHGLPFALLGIMVNQQTLTKTFKLLGATNNTNGANTNRTSSLSGLGRAGICLPTGRRWLGGPLCRRRAALGRGASRVVTSDRRLRRPAAERKHQQCECDNTARAFRRPAALEALVQLNRTADPCNAYRRAHSFATWSATKAPLCPIGLALPVVVSSMV